MYYERINLEIRTKRLSLVTTQVVNARLNIGVTEIVLGKNFISN